MRGGYVVGVISACLKEAHAIAPDGSESDGSGSEICLEKSEVTYEIQACLGLGILFFIIREKNAWIRCLLSQVDTGDSL